MGPGPLVLCIDHDSNRAYSLVQAVKRAGFQPTLATSIPVAMRAIEAFMPDAVVVREQFRFNREELRHFFQTLRADVPAVLLVAKRPARTRKPPGIVSSMVVEDSEPALRMCLLKLLSTTGSFPTEAS